MSDTKEKIKKALKMAKLMTQFKLDYIEIDSIIIKKSNHTEYVPQVEEATQDQMDEDLYWSV